MRGCLSKAICLVFAVCGVAACATTTAVRPLGSDCPKSESDCLRYHHDPYMRSGGVAAKVVMLDELPQRSAASRRL